MIDDRTIAVYNAKAEDYARLVQKSKPDEHLRAFIGDLPKGAHVLDLGCGPAKASSFMKEAGLVPDPVDASDSMVKLANETFNIGARVGRFDEIDGVEVYDGIWANFSLLHAAEDELPLHIAALTTTLKPNGVFHIAMKVGEGTRRDALDRRYTFVTEEELRYLLENVGLTIVDQDAGEEAGLDGKVSPWIMYRARKDG